MEPTKKLSIEELETRLAASRELFRAIRDGL